MHKNTSEKIKDFFILMGKKYRILLPIAILGLAVSMFVISFLDYCKRGTIRFVCLLFVLCFFLIGNSFAFPIFNFGNGFIGDEEANEPEIIEESDLTLADDNIQGLGNDTSKVSISEYGEIEENETVSLEEILGKNEIKVEDYEEETIVDNNLVFDRNDWRLVLINKQHPIPENYEFTLGTLSGSMQCDSRIIDDLLLMMKKAKEEGIDLMVCSPYRDLSKQETLFLRKINMYMKNGYSYIDAYKLSSQAVTVPGASEHQVGLAIDFITKNYTLLDEGFANTEAGMWLASHCAEYGFVIRYPKDKEYITSIEYEPWHFRYVGREAARIIMDESICLEEFWDKYM